MTIEELQAEITRLRNFMKEIRTSVDAALSTAWPPPTEKHRCEDHEHIIECKAFEIDTVQCTVCKKVWTRPCNFDEDYA